MFVRLIQKELLHHLLDSRFAVVFAFCILLSGLGTYAGIQNHSQQRQQYQAVAVKNRELIEKVREKGGMFDLEGLWLPMEPSSGAAQSGGLRAIGRIGAGGADSVQAVSQV